MNSRRRTTMEDIHRIIPQLLTKGDFSYSYFGVYDGHGGRQIVDFLETKLETNIATEIAAEDDAGMFERLTRAFLITDMESKQCKLTTAGATAVSAIIQTEQHPQSGTVLSKKLFIANVGDSRAVLATLSTEGGSCVASRLSYDHRAEDESEQRRIAEAGGFMARGRVLGILAVTRSFGDHGMKDFVIAQPHLSESDLPLTPTCPFLILACDGVWDVFSDQQAADLLLERYLESGCQPFPEAAKILVDAAIAKGSTDNITAIVIFL